MTPGKKPATPDQKPNIVFFLWDNLGWGEVGCYGGGVLRGAPTPRVDALARAGFAFTEFQRRSAVHAEPLSHPNRAPPDPVGDSHYPHYWGAGRIDPLGGEHRANPLRTRSRRASARCISSTASRTMPPSPRFMTTSILNAASRPSNTCQVRQGECR